MIKVKNVQSIICLVIFFIFANQAWAEDWIYYGTNSIGDKYYDKSRIEVNKSITSVWTKNILSKEAKTKYFSILKSINKAPKNPSMLSYYTELLEIDYANKKIKNISVIFYNEKGNVIYSSPKSVSGEWNAIPPDSVGEKLLKMLSGGPVTPKEAVVYAPVVNGKNQTQIINQADKKSELATGSAPLVAVRETGRDERFIAYDNQTVLDTQTNLMWAAKDNGQDTNWYEAHNYCENYRGGGYTDWRMPTKNELAELYDRNNPKNQACYPKYEIYLTNLIDLSCCCPWASETDGSEAAYFNFDHGRWRWDDRSNDVNKMYRVLPVRTAK